MALGETLSCCHPEPCCGRAAVPRSFKIQSDPRPVCEGRAFVLETQICPNVTHIVSKKELTWFSQEPSPRAQPAAVCCVSRFPGPLGYLHGCHQPLVRWESQLGRVWLAELCALHSPWSLPSLDSATTSGWCHLTGQHHWSCCRCPMPLASPGGCRGSSSPLISAVELGPLQG